MSCWHGWHGGHGCGPWYGPPYGPDPYGPAEWAPEPVPARWRGRRPGRFEGEEGTEDLEARLADLRDTVRRMEAELAELRGQEHTAPEGR
jgi:hypothetical protein